MIYQEILQYQFQYILYQYQPHIKPISTLLTIIVQVKLNKHPRILSKTLLTTNLYISNNKISNVSANSFEQHQRYTSRSIHWKHVSKPFTGTIVLTCNTFYHIFSLALIIKRPFLKLLCLRKRLKSLFQFHHLIQFHWNIVQNFNLPQMFLFCLIWNMIPFWQQIIKN